MTELTRPPWELFFKLYLDKLWEFVEKALGHSSYLEDAVHPFIKSSFNWVL